MIGLRTLIHYSLHFLAPAILAWLLFKNNWEMAWLIMVTTNLVDIDHLLARPIFDPDRCSLGAHPLHSIYAIIIYILLLFIPDEYVKIIAVGLLFHMLTDFQDSLWKSHFRY